MQFMLPKLPYKFSDLEPYIDTQTMEIHYTKHHQAYIDNLNKTLENISLEDNMTLEKLMENIHIIPEEHRQSVINNGGGHLNHTLYWSIMTPHIDENAPTGKFKDALEQTFGSRDKFWEIFKTKSMSLFGSGWTFLVIKSENKLDISRHSFQNSPLLKGEIPIIGIDLWEHAYYLKYQNRKAEYVDAWKNVVNWNEASAIFEKSLSL